jgi:hypothetical protein
VEQGRSRFVAATIGLCVLIAGFASGCGGSGDPTSTGRNVDPVKVTLVADDATPATAEIGSSGGTLDATATDGTHYHLVVPAGAVAATTKITMTPLESIEGLPARTELAFGVRFSPDGQLFVRPSWLYVQLPTARNVRAGLTIDDDDIASLRRIGFDGTNYVLPVAHFSGTGGVGPLGPGWGNRFPPSPGAGSRQSGALDSPGPVDVPPPGGAFPPGATTPTTPPGPGDSGGTTSGGDLSGSGGHGTGDSLTDGGGGDSLADELRDAIDDLGEAQLTGDEEGEKQAEKKIDKLKEKVRDRVDKLADVCINHKNINALKDMLHWQGIGQALGFDDDPKEAEYQQQLIEACNQFEMETYGEFDLDQPPVFAISDSIDVKVPLAMEGAQYQGSASGPMKTKGYERGGEILELLGQGIGALIGVEVPNDITKNDYVQCRVSTPQGNIAAVATGLVGDADPTVVVTPSLLTSAHVSCAQPPIDFDVPPFITDLEMNAEGGVPGASPEQLVVQGWERPPGGKPVATKEIHAEMSEDGATIKFSWHFTIVHKPGERPKRG